MSVVMNNRYLTCVCVYSFPLTFFLFSKNIILYLKLQKSYGSIVLGCYNLPSFSVRIVFKFLSCYSILIFSDKN